MSGLLLQINRGLSGALGFLIWAVGLAAVLAGSARPGSSPVEEDELYWVGSAYYFHLACVEHDFANADWRLLPARENPPVAKYVIGAAVALAGEQVSTPDLLAGFYLRFAGIAGAWGGPGDQAKRSAVVTRMSPEFVRLVRASGRVVVPAACLRPARLAMVGCIVGASLGLFVLARTLVPAPLGLVVSIALPLHPIVAEAMNHVSADAPALMLSTAASVSLVACLRGLWRGRPLGLTMRLAIGAGIFSGLACAAKMNALVVPLLAGVVFGLAPLLARGKGGLARAPFSAVVAAALLFGLAAVGGFIAVNPALYGEVWAGLRATVEEHRRTGEIQAAFLLDRLDTWWDRLGAMGLLIGFSRWAWIPLSASAVVLGFAGSLRHRFLAGWWLLAWLTVSLWIPFLRLRYAAPALLPTLLLLAAVADFVLLRFRATVRPPAPARVA